MTMRQALELLLVQVTDVVTAQSLPLTIAVGWPSIEIIQNVPKGLSSIGCIYDMGGTHDMTRWPRGVRAQADTLTPAGTTLISPPSVLLAAGGSVSFTLGGTTVTNDAVVFTAQPLTALLSPAILGNAIAGPSDTPTTLAAALAASITSAGGATLSASATGPSVTVTASSGVPSMSVSVNIGNVGQASIELRRQQRHVRVVTWSPNEVARQQVGDPLDQLFASLDDYFGLWVGTQGASESVRVRYHDDMYLEKDQLMDIYRRDFHLSLEYGTTQLEALYPVLGVSASLTPLTP